MQYIQEKNQVSLQLLWELDSQRKKTHIEGWKNVLNSQGLASNIQADWGLCCQIQSSGREVGERHCWAVGGWAQGVPGGWDSAGMLVSNLIARQHRAAQATQLCSELCHQNIGVAPSRPIGAAVALLRLQRKLALDVEQAYWLAYSTSCYNHILKQSQHCVENNNNKNSSTHYLQSVICRVWEQP